MKRLFTTLCMAAALPVFAQDANELESYLKTHQVQISANNNKLQLNDEIASLLAAKMQNKNLFVLSEGNHKLPLNGQAWVMLQEHFSGKGLKYCFMEDGRATCMLANLSPDKPVMKSVSNPMAEADVMAIRMQENTIVPHGDFEYIGIDYERPWTFYEATTMLLSELDEQKRNRVYSIAPYLRAKKNAVKPEEFAKTYKDMRESFAKDSTRLKVLMPEQIGDLAYLLSNPSINEARRYRDRDMAENLLDHLYPMDASATYLLNCGYYHGTPAIKGNMVSRLNDSKELKDKIVVMNVYCDVCTGMAQGLTDKEVLKDEHIAAMRTSANSDIVIYDLSALPEKYKKLKAHGDLLLFAKNTVPQPTQTTIQPAVYKEVK